MLRTDEIKMLMGGERRRAGIVQRALYRLFGIKRRKSDK